uniref:PDZ domain-containing protein n=1 Tax=Hanusia phi TaxID=3032 RepID=A0A7S0ERH2_9CRYP|mmetsp:Transcript_2961/g.7128  ORF Transcript_2961/g.7128 Transcript_2961/m.7128 type:complete len:177 (+) Transcript_2961:1-531(+)
MHAVDGQDIYPLTPEQVTALIIGTPGTMVRLLISSPSDLQAPELPPDQGLEQFVIMRDETGRVGMDVWKSTNNAFEVVAVQPNGPASRVNLQVGDYIHGINQFSLYDKDVNEVNTLLNGMPHSVVSVWKQTFKASVQASQQLPAEMIVQENEVKPVEAAHDPSPDNFYVNESQRFI